MGAGRALLDDLLAGKATPRPLYVPILSRLAARVGGTSLERMGQEPTAWAASIAKASELFDLDASVLRFDSWILAQALGCEVRWSEDRPRVEAPSSWSTVQLRAEVLKRGTAAAAHLFHLVRPKRGCIVSLTGPLELSCQLFGPEQAVERLGDAKQYLVSLLEAFCSEAKPDLLLFLEGAWPGSALEFHKCKRAYRTLKNVCSYFNVPIAVYAQGRPSAEPEEYRQLGADLYLFGADREGRVAAPSFAAEAAADAVAAGVELPFAAAEEATRLVDDWRGACAARRVPLVLCSREREDAPDLEVDGVWKILEVLR